MAHWRMPCTMGSPRSIFANGAMTSRIDRLAATKYPNTFHLDSEERIRDRTDISPALTICNRMLLAPEALFSNRRFHTIFYDLRKLPCVFE